MGSLFLLVSGSVAMPMSASVLRCSGTVSLGRDMGLSPLTQSLKSAAVKTGAAFSPLGVLYPLHLRLSKCSVFSFFMFSGCYQLEAGLSMHGNLFCIPVSAARGCCRMHRCLRPSAALMCMLLGDSTAPGPYAAAASISKTMPARHQQPCSCQVHLVSEQC